MLSKKTNTIRNNSCIGIYVQQFFTPKTILTEISDFEPFSSFFNILTLMRAITQNNGICSSFKNVLTFLCPFLKSANMEQ